MSRLFHLLLPLGLFVLLPAEEPQAVATFHSLGLRWRPTQTPDQGECRVEFRAEGTTRWQEGQPLWRDRFAHPDAPEHRDEFRGSLVNLQPSQTYEIRLTLGAEQRIFRATTWAETFPVKTRRLLPAGPLSEPLQLEEGGDETGYVLYEPPAGQTTIVDVGSRHARGVIINASRVILRGVTVRGGREHGVVLGDVQDVVIEDCDISGWGSAKPGLPWGVNLQSGIYSDSRVLERIVIQRNRIHHPASDANSWAENGHPEGPQGITFRGSRGRLVIRYNEIYSDDAHGFNDGMGEVENFSHAGFPNRDSDIYCNRISHCWDDAIEAEGANLNVRIWANYLDQTFVGLGLATTSLGPQYVFRNVSAFSRKDPPGFGPAPYPNGGYLFKLGTKRPRADTLARGAVFLYHNTILQPLHDGRPAGMRRGAFVTDRTYGVWNVTSRNNLIHTRSPGDEAVRDPLRDPANNFDFDLYTGTVEAADGAEARGWAAAPRYVLGAPEPAPLAPDSPGADTAWSLANFNTPGFRGRGPDVGAVEAGLPPLPFGITADWTAWLRSALPASP